MSTVHRATTSAVRATFFFILSALASTGALAAGGSTDMYANDFVASFETSARPSASPSIGRSYHASTDTWSVDGFRASFEPADADVRSARACGSGSTDAWGANGFRASFGPAAYPASIDLAQACQSALR